MSGSRPSVLSGSWYTADADRLAAEVDGYLAAADPAAAPSGRPLVAVVPHAGFAYSGPVAGKLFGLLAAWDYSRIVILAPNHRVPVRNIALSGADRYHTPLGTVPVDTEAVARLAASPGFSVDDAAHGPEHAIEIQLPFLQRTWPRAVPAIVPLLVPAQVRDGDQAAAALAELRDAHTLLLVSTDFTHFGPAYGFTPFAEDIPASLEKLDTGAIIRILGADAAGLRSYGRETGITMCGLEAAAMALDCGLPMGYEGALVDYRRSGDRDRDYSLSVSYAAILLSSGGGTGPDQAGSPDV